MTPQRYLRGSLCGLALTALGLAAIPVQPVSAQAVRAGQETGRPGYSAAQVKAAFLYHFGSYVRWPALPGVEKPLRIAVLDAPEIAGELERFVAGRTIRGRPVVIRRLRTINSLTDEELLYIGADDNRRLDELVDAVGKRPTLVVTDAPDGLAAGAMINFQIVERRVRFEISLTRAREAGLMLSSRLLAAALRVETTRCSALCRGAAESPPRLEASERGPRPAR